MTWRFRRASFQWRLEKKSKAARCDELVVTSSFEGGVHDNAYRGDELTGKFSSLKPHQGGSRGRGRPECVRLDEGYAPGTSSEYSTRLSFPNDAYHLSSQMCVGVELKMDQIQAGGNCGSILLHE